MPKLKPYIISRWREILILLLISLAIWLPRASGLDSFVYIDETTWLQRSANFYYALGQGEFDRTLQNFSPGVVTMWVETAAFFTEFRGYRVLADGYYGYQPSPEDKMQVYYQNKYDHLEEFLISQNIDPHDILVTSRAYMVILISLVLSAAFYLAYRLFGAIPAIVAFLLISFDPFYLANTRFAHLDGPMSAFILLSLLAFISYLYRQRSVVYLLISAIAAALALLSKLPGLIILPTIGILVFMDIYENSQLSGLRQRLTDISEYKKYIKPLAIWGAVFVLTIFVVWPAMWVSFIELFYNLFLYPIKFTLAPESGIIRNSEVESAQQTARDWLRYPNSFLWLTTPVILIGLIAAGWAYIKRIAFFADQKVRKSIFALALFALLFTLLISVPLKSSARYLIPVHATLDLIAGLGWVAIAAWIAERISFTSRRMLVSSTVLVAVIIYQVTVSLQLYPYYLPYNNPLMGGNEAANESRYISFGEGLDQAAQYLNTKPDARNLKVISWYAFGPFSMYFEGHTFDVQLLESRPEALFAMDYLISYRNAWYREELSLYNAALDKIEPEKVIWLHGIEYVRIYNVSTLPTDIFEFEQ